VHDLPVPTLAVDRRTRVGRLKMLAVLAVCAAPVVASYLSYFVIRPSARSNYAELIDPPRPIPPGLPLTRLDGSSVDPSTLLGQWLIVVVSGGACDTACDRRIFLQRQLRELLGRDRDRVDKLWLVDDRASPPEAMLAAVRAVPGQTVLRVPRDALERWLAPAAGSDLHAHLYLVDPQGAWMMRAPAEPDPQKLKRDLERLLRASSAWDRPGR
jgi:cytochrome oxidase Cu insertion factor (SCO1/SenC/PrrC family)